MNDSITTIKELKDKINSFSKERGWIEHDNPKDLTMALSIEASELMEIFQWLHSDEADSVKDDAARFEHLKEEIADVFWYTIRLCQHFQIDLTSAVEDKSVKNAIKYPAK